MKIKLHQLELDIEEGNFSVISGSENIKGIDCNSERITFITDLDSITFNYKTESLDIFPLEDPVIVIDLPSNVIPIFPFLTGPHA